MGRGFWIGNIRWLVVPLLVLSSSTAAQDLVTLKFEGHYRDKPKTSIVRSAATGAIKPPVHYADLNALLASLPADDAMRGKYPDLDRKRSGFPEKREPEELKNVSVDCWIYAVKFEDGRGRKKGDNDLHVIIGSTSNSGMSSFMTAEVSGLPSSGKNVAPLTIARKSFFDIFPGVTFTSRFKRITPPEKVSLQGSLFFDGDHQAGCGDCPGPSWAKPKTAWEIHPVVKVGTVQ